MQSFRFLILIILLIVSFISCDKNDIINSSDEQIVVDGWIEDEGMPIVLLTKSSTIDHGIHYIDEITNYFVINANVRIVSEGDTIQLPLSIDDRYFPPYIYTTDKLIGHSGQKYELLIDTPDNHHLSAVTSIPAKVEVDSFQILNSEISDTLFSIKGFFKDIPNEKNYYKYFVKVTNENITDTIEYYASLFFSNIYLSPGVGGVINDVVSDTNISFIINRGFINSDSNYITDFRHGDIVNVKFAQVNNETYRFWYDMQTSIIFGNSFFINSSKNISSNINGGLGAWCGYGANYYTINIP